MIKTFVTMVSLQGKGELWKGLYLPDGFSLKENRETSFPIIPIIANEVNGDEKVKVIVIRQITQIHRIITRYL